MDSVILSLRVVTMVRRACNDLPNGGYSNISCSAVERLLKAKKAHLTIDQRWSRGRGRSYEVTSTLDGGVYGRGKTPVEALAWCVQNFPMFHIEVLGFSSFEPWEKGVLGEQSAEKDPLGRVWVRGDRTTFDIIRPGKDGTYRGKIFESKETSVCV